MNPRTSTIVPTVFEELVDYALAQIDQRPREEVGREPRSPHDDPFPFQPREPLFVALWNFGGFDVTHLPECTSAKLMRNQLRLFPHPANHILRGVSAQ